MGIDERDPPSVLLDRVSANVLRDAASLSLDHVNAKNGIQQRRLAVIDVAEKRHHGRTGNQIARVIDGMREAVAQLILQAHGLAKIHFDPQFQGQQLHGLDVELRIDGDHLLHRHQLALNRGVRNAHGGRERTHRAGHLHHHMFFAGGRNGIGADHAFFAART